MGLFDQVVGAVTGSANSPADAGNPLIASIMQLLSSPQTGGLAGLIQSFSHGGLAEIANSWISTGKNLTVSPDQIKNIIGNDQVGKVASQLGITPDQASAHIAEYLPQIVDKLTPNGSVPEGGDLMAQGLELLKGKLFG